MKCFICWRWNALSNNNRQWILNTKSRGKPSKFNTSRTTGRYVLSIVQENKKPCDEEWRERGKNTPPPTAKQFLYKTAGRYMSDFVIEAMETKRTGSKIQTVLGKEIRQANTACPDVHHKPSREPSRGAATRTSH